MSLFPIIVTALVTFVLGFLWYGAIGGNLWVQLKEIPAAKVAAMQAKGMGPMVPKMFGNIVIQLVLVSALQYILLRLSITTYAPAAMVATILWLGFIVAPFYNAVLWEERKVALYVFDVLFYLCNVVLAAILLVWLR